MPRPVSIVTSVDDPVGIQTSVLEDIVTSSTLDWVDISSDVLDDRVLTVEVLEVI